MSNHTPAGPDGTPYPPVSPGQFATPPPGQPSPVQAPPRQPSAGGDQQPPGIDERGRVETTRSSSAYVGLIAAALVLVLLLVFIGQNSQRVTIHYLGLSGHISLAIALLLAAVLGALLLAIPGTVRILQLRRNLKRSAQTGSAVGVQDPARAKRGRRGGRRAGSSS